MQHVYFSKYNVLFIKIKKITSLYRIILLRFDQITDIRNMQIFDKSVLSPPKPMCLMVCGKYLTDTSALKPVNMHQDASALKALCLHTSLFSN